MVTVSVVVPFRDAERYLSEAIGSVQAQTCTDWELLLVDDGSKDDSAGIVAAAAADDPSIRLLQCPPDAPGGAAAARNVGIRQARGSFVAFLDADDVYEPDSLRSRLQAFATHPDVMMVYGPTRWWHPGAEERDWTERMRRERGRVHQPPELLNRVVLSLLGDVPCTCGVMVRRSAFEVTGGFDEAFHLYEDQTLWAKLMLRFPVYVTDVVGARYRQHADSVTAHSQRSGVYESRRFGDYDRTCPHQARIAFLAWVGDHAKSNGLSDDSVERTLRLATASCGDGRVRLTATERVTLAGHRVGRRARLASLRIPRLLRRALRKPG